MAVEEKALTEEQIANMYREMADTGESEEEYFSRIEKQGDDDSVEDTTETTEESEETLIAEPEAEEEQIVDAGDTDISQKKVTPIKSDKSKELETERQRYNSLKGIADKQGEELRALRQQSEALSPFIQSMNDAQFRQHVLNFYNRDAQSAPTGTAGPQLDFDDPSSIEKVIESKVQRKIAELQQQQSVLTRQQQQQLFIRNWQNRVQQNRQAAISKGRDESFIDASLNSMQKAFMEGNAIDIALRYADFDAAIQEAEKRGRESVLKTIQEKKKGSPPRSVAAGGKEGKGKSKAVDELEVDEMAAELENPETPEKRREAIIRRGIKIGLLK